MNSISLRSSPKTGHGPPATAPRPGSARPNERPRIGFRRLGPLVVVTLLAACDVISPPPVGRIAGRVIIEGQGVAGVTVSLSGGPSTTTAGDGTFGFDGVEGGTYTVTISGFPLDATFASTTSSATIESDGETVIVEFRGQYIRTATLVGRVAAEGDPLSDVTVRLSGMSESLTSTDAVGQFAFPSLRAGGYTVAISEFGAVQFPRTGQSVTVAVGESKVVSFDGTYPRTASISGRVSIEGTSLAGIVVTLTGFGETATARSDGNGEYSFGQLRAGTYNIAISGFDPTDVTFSETSSSVQVAVGESKVWDFDGIFVRESTIMGMVTVEGLRLPGITVTISGPQDAETMTDASGQYTFTGLRAGTYTIEISDFDPTDVAFSSASGAVTVAVGESKVHSFDGTYVRESTIMGRVSVEGNGLADVTVSLQGMGADEEVRTDDGGQYTFDNLRAGEYSVAISGYDAREYGFETTAASVTVEHGETANVPFEGILLRTASIMGQVSVEGEGLANVTVSLQGEGENQTTVTDNTGQFSFTDLPAGNFQVGISGYDTDDYSFETSSRNVSLPLGATATVPFEGIRLRTAVIMGLVRVGGAGLRGVTATLVGGDLEEAITTTTDSNGQYRFGGLAAGNYSVTISGYDTTRYSFEITSRNLALARDGKATVTFNGDRR